MGEFGLIEKLKKTLPDPSKRVLVGIGDDTLVARTPKERLLWTVDCLVENIHFDFNYYTPQEIGWKALAVNLSDIAAMGGTSLYALVSLAIPKRVSKKRVVEIYEGIRACAQWARVDVVGGNVSRSLEDFFIDITVVGEANKPLLRSGAGVGEVVAITGFPGLSAAGFLALQKWGKKARKRYPLSTYQHVHPQPRLEWAKKLKGLGVTSLIDISDGLSSELHHVTGGSKVGFEIEERLLPVADEVKQIAQATNQNPLDLACHGGEQYELLMTFPLSRFSKISSSAEKDGVPLTRIGHTVSLSQGVKIRTLKGKLRPLKSKGWTHF